MIIRIVKVLNRCGTRGNSRNNRAKSSVIVYSMPAYARARVYMCVRGRRLYVYVATHIHPRRDVPPRSHARARAPFLISPSITSPFVCPLRARPCVRPPIVPDENSIGRSPPRLAPRVSRREREIIVSKRRSREDRRADSIAHESYPSVSPMLAGKLGRSFPRSEARATTHRSSFN